MSDIVSPIPDRAGLYVLGLLRGQERRDFEADLAVDPVLAGEVSAWENRLLPLALSVPPVEPPAQIWQEIERILAPRGAPVASVRSRRSNWRERFWNNVVVWRGIGGVAIAAAVLFAVLPQEQATTPHMIAVLAGKAGPVFTVAVRSNGAMSIAPVGHIKPPPGKVWQLWAVAGGEKPVAVGFVQARASVLPAGQIPSGLRKPQILMAVTVEPPGGSPTGQPDTPIVFSGPILPINQ